VSLTVETCIMASVSSSNTYYQTNVYPLIADFLDDFEQEQKRAPPASSPLNTSVEQASNQDIYSNVGGNPIPQTSSLHSSIDKISLNSVTYMNQSNANNHTSSHVNSYGVDDRNDRLDDRGSSSQLVTRNQSYNHSMHLNDLNNSNPKEGQHNQYTTKLLNPRSEPFDLHRVELNNEVLSLTNAPSSPTKSQITAYDPFYDPYSNYSSLTPYNGYDKNNLPPKVQRFKEKRIMATAATAGAGIVVGGVLGGPVGMVVGGYGGYAIAKSVGKVRQKKILEKCLNDEAAAKGANYKCVEFAEMT
jgi:hypothetical protein